MKMDAKAVALIIYAIERAYTLYKEGKMDEEQTKEQARRDAIRFAVAIDQVEEEISYYGKEKPITTR